MGGINVEEAKIKLIERLEGCINVVSMLLALGCLITLAVLIYTFLSFSKLSKKEKIASPIGCSILICACLFNAFWLQPMLCDREYLKSNEPIYIAGELIDFANASGDESGEVTRYSPIIRIYETDEKITLNITNSEERMEIGETYEIIYLPNTKLGEIIE